MSSEPDPGKRPGRLVADVQRFGLSSAAAVVDRYTSLVTTTLGNPAQRDSATPSGGPLAATETASIVEATALLAEGYLRLLDGVSALAGSPGAQVGTSTAGGGQPDAATIAQVALPPAHAGESSTVPIWMHNPTPKPILGYGITLGGFLAADGCTIPAQSVSVTPGSVAAPAGGSAEFSIVVDLPIAQPPGRYAALAFVRTQHPHGAQRPPSSDDQSEPGGVSERSGLAEPGDPSESSGQWQPDPIIVSLEVLATGDER